MLLAQAELDAYFSAVDERDNEIARLDELAIEQEFADDDVDPPRPNKA